jgi:hypothetical protein
MGFPSFVAGRYRSRIILKSGLLPTGCRRNIVSKGMSILIRKK